MEKTFSVIIEGVYILKLVLSKKEKIVNIKNFFLKEYSDFNIRLNINSSEELKIFTSNKYDNLTLESIWEKIKDGSFILKKSKIFTNIKDVDKLILNNLNDKELYKVILTNKYLYELTLDDIFWFNRIMKFYKIDPKYKLEKYSWKEYYIRMKKTLKVVIVGDIMTGKTTFCQKILGNNILHYNPTLGVCVDHVSVNKRSFIFWDCAGNDGMAPGLRDGYYTKGDCAIIFADSQNLESIKNISSYDRDLKRLDIFQIVVVINKSELLSDKDIKRLKESQPDFIFISLKDNKNIDKIFERI